MLKAEEGTFSLLHKIFDFSLGLVLWLSLYFFRFHFFSGAYEGLWVTFLNAGFLLAGLTLFFFSKEGLHRSNRLSSLQEEVFKTLKGNTLAVVSFVLLFYFLMEGRISRSVILSYYLLSTPVFILVRLSLRSVLRYYRRRGYNLRHVLLIGGSRSMSDYVENILRFRDAGISFIGWVDSGGMAEKFGIRQLMLDEVINNRDLHPDSIVVGYGGQEVARTDFILRQLHNDVIPIVVLPDLTYSFIGYRIETLAGVPALVVNQPNITALDLLMKRILDLVVSFTALLLLSPLLFFIGLMVTLSSPGPVFFGQERIGLDGRRFRMWKFRSMRVSQQEAGWTVKNDPRRTKIGTFLRSTSLDELPQLWNIFVGDMSLVGPRPEQTQYVDRFRNEIPAYMLRHKMKAGLTGWAQVNGWRGDTSLHKRIECDLYYIRNWSIWLDLKILLLTFIKGFINRNAY